MAESRRVSGKPSAAARPRVSKEWKIKVAAILIVLFFLGTALIAMITTNGTAGA